MQKIQGYFDLTSVLKIEIDDYESSFLTKYFFKIISSVPTVKVLNFEEGKQILFSFDYEDETYFFKADSDGNNYSELLAYEICHELGIESVKYYLARIGACKGVISKNYKVKDATYVTGKTIIMESLRDICDKDNLKWRNFNSLESIRASFEYRYSKREDYEKIVAKLMDKIVKMFMLDILLGNPDRTLLNWEIIEYTNGNVDVQPVFDNMRIMSSHPSTTIMAMTVHDCMENNVYFSRSLEENIYKFRKFSGYHFIMLKEWIKLLKLSNLKQIKRRIEFELKCPIPKEVLKHFAQCSIRQLQFLRCALSIPIENDLYFIDFDNFFKEGLIEMETLGSKELYGLIKPSEKYFFSVEDPRFKNVSKIFGFALNNIYEDGQNIDSRYFVNVHFIFLKLYVEVEIKTPKIITKYQMLHLKEIFERLAGYINVDLLRIKFTITNFNPLFDACDENFTQLEFCGGIDIIKDILNKIVSKGFVVDYDLPFPTRKRIEKTLELQRLDEVSG